MYSFFFLFSFSLLIKLILQNNRRWMSQHQKLQSWVLPECSKRKSQFHSCGFCISPWPSLAPGEGNKKTSYLMSGLLPIYPHPTPPHPTQHTHTHSLSRQKGRPRQLLSWEPGQHTHTLTHKNTRSVIPLLFIVMLKGLIWRPSLLLFQVGEEAGRNTG